VLYVLLGFLVIAVVWGAGVLTLFLSHPRRSP